MIQQELLTKDLTTVGEDIGYELGAKMVKDFQDANPDLLVATFVGKNIISQILEQPGCVGIRFFNAINEDGKNTLVYVGVDKEGNNILEYSIVAADGNIHEVNAVVADRGASISWFA